MIRIFGYVIQSEFDYDNMQIDLQKTHAALHNANLKNIRLESCVHKRGENENETKIQRLTSQLADMTAKYHAVCQENRHLQSELDKLSRPRQ